MPPRVTVNNLSELIDAITTALVGTSGVGVMELGRVLIDGTLYTKKSARVNASASGNTQLIPAVPGKKIVLLSWNVGPASAAVTVIIHDASTTPIVLAGPFPVATNGGTNNSVEKESDQESAPGLAVNVNLSGAITGCPVSVTYVEK